MATISPEIYSNRPWPKGWPGSGFCPARRKPSMVTRLDPASDRLLKASAVMAMEPETVPARSFPKKSSTLSPTPTQPHSIPYCRRTAGSFTCSRSRMNIRAKNVSMCTLSFAKRRHRRPFSSIISSPATALLRRAASAAAS